MKTSDILISALAVAAVGGVIYYIKQNRDKAKTQPATASNKSANAEIDTSNYAYDSDYQTDYSPDYQPDYSPEYTYDENTEYPQAETANYEAPQAAPTKEEIKFEDFSKMTDEQLIERMEKSREDSNAFLRSSISEAQSLANSNIGSFKESLKDFDMNKKSTECYNLLYKVNRSISIVEDPNGVYNFSETQKQEIARFLPTLKKVKNELDNIVSEIKNEILNTINQPISVSSTRQELEAYISKLKKYTEVSVSVGIINQDEKNKIEDRLKLANATFESKLRGENIINRIGLTPEQTARIISENIVAAEKEKEQTLNDPKATMQQRVRAAAKVMYAELNKPELSNSQVELLQNIASRERRKNSDKKEETYLKITSNQNFNQLQNNPEGILDRYTDLVSNSLQLLKLFNADCAYAGIESSLLRETDIYNLRIVVSQYINKKK